jgi:hypothetical protein
MIKSLPQSLIETATKLLMETRLFEMAYERKKAIDLISSLDTQLADHMTMIEHSPESLNVPHWKTEVNAFLSKIHRSSKLKGNKILKKDDLHANLWDGPMGEQSDYHLTHTTITNIKPEESFTSPSNDSHAAIHRRYNRAFDYIQKNITPTYDMIKDDI